MPLYELSNLTAIHIIRRIHLFRDSDHCADYKEKPELSSFLNSAIIE